MRLRDSNERDSNETWNPLSFTCLFRFESSKKAHEKSENILKTKESINTNQFMDCKKSRFPQ